MRGLGLVYNQTNGGRAKVYDFYWGDKLEKLQMYWFEYSNKGEIPIYKESHGIPVNIMRMDSRRQLFDYLEQNIFWDRINAAIGTLILHHSPVVYNIHRYQRRHHTRIQ